MTGGRVSGKVAIVSGAARGIGEATATLLAQEGARVAIWDRDRAGAEALASRLQAGGHEAIGDGVDVTDRQSLEQAAQRVVAEFGGIDALINNAGITVDRSLMKMTEEDFDKVIAVNLKGVFNCTQAVVPHLVARGGGAIANASSIVALYGNFGQTNYVASKAGVIGMTRTWARELGRKAIRVNAVAPGFIATDMTAAMPEEVLAGMRDKTPLGRLGAAADIAKAYLFLISDDASFITGHVLSVDGGLVI